MNKEEKKNKKGKNFFTAAFCKQNRIEHKCPGNDQKIPEKKDAGRDSPMIGLSPVCKKQGNGKSDCQTKDFWRVFAGAKNGYILFHIISQGKGHSGAAGFDTVLGVVEFNGAVLI